MRSKSAVILMKNPDIWDIWRYKQY